MGALSGSVTATEFFVRGELPKDFRESYLERLQKRRFRDIDLKSDDDESMGWVTTLDPFATEFTLNDVLWGDYIMVTLRHDSIRIPPAAFKLHLNKEINEVKAAKGKEKLSKAEQEELKDALHKKLRKRVMPSIKTYDVVWNIDRNLVWLFTANKRVSETFQEFWADTFELPLVPKTPYSLLERLNDEALIEQALAVEPTNFASPNA